MKMLQDPSNITLSNSSTNITEEFEVNRGLHSALHLIIFIGCWPSLLLACFTTAVLWKIKSVKSIKVSLTNLNVSMVLYIIGLMTWTGGFPMRVYHLVEAGHCLASIYPLSMGALMSFLSLIVYGVTVYFVIVKGPQKIKTSVVLGALLAIWVSGILFTFLPICLPQYNFTAYIDYQGICMYSEGLFLYVHTGIGWVIFGLGSCITTGSLVLAIYCHIKRNTLGIDAESINKAMLKLTLFLVIAVLALIFVNMVTPIFVLVTGNVLKEIWIHYYAAPILLMVSSWPIPMSILLVYKPIRTEAKKAILCKWKLHNKVATI